MKAAVVTSAFETVGIEDLLLSLLGRPTKKCLGVFCGSATCGPEGKSAIVWSSSEEHEAIDRPTGDAVGAERPLPATHSNEGVLQKRSEG